MNIIKKVPILPVFYFYLKFNLFVIYFDLKQRSGKQLESRAFGEIFSQLIKSPEETVRTELCRVILLNIKSSPQHAMALYRHLADNAASFKSTPSVSCVGVVSVVT